MLPRSRSGSPARLEQASVPHSIRNSISVSGRSNSSGSSSDALGEDNTPAVSIRNRNISSSSVDDARGSASLGGASEGSSDAGSTRDGNVDSDNDEGEEPAASSGGRSSAAGSIASSGSCGASSSSSSTGSARSSIDDAGSGSCSASSSSSSKASTPHEADAADSEDNSVGLDLAELTDRVLDRLVAMVPVGQRGGLRGACRFCRRLVNRAVVSITVRVLAILFLLCFTCLCAPQCVLPMWLLRTSPLRLLLRSHALFSCCYMSQQASFWSIRGRHDLGQTI